jgi:hypothetical protein
MNFLTGQAVLLARGYANGADSNTNGTRENASNNYGNGGFAFSPTATVAAGICGGVALIVILGVGFYYARKLDLRRKIDMRNRERRSAVENGRPDSVLGSPGDPIPLDHLHRHPGVSARTAEKRANEYKELPLPPPPAQLSLWHYVNWKDPHNTKILVPTPQGQPSEP